MDELSSTGVPTRIIQDPESLRANSQRNGSAWEAWSRLKDNILIQVNSSTTIRRSCRAPRRVTRRS